MGYFEAGGERVIGRLAIAGTNVPSDKIALHVSEAVGRCKNKRYAGRGRALKELQQLFDKYPQLKREAWAAGEHPAAPLIAVFVEETLQ